MKSVLFKRMDMKEKTYLKPGEQPPEGVQVKTGSRGGKYIDGGVSGQEKPVTSKVTSEEPSKHETEFFEDDEDNEMMFDIVEIIKEKEEQGVESKDIVNSLLDDSNLNSWLKQKFRGNEFDLRQSIETGLTKDNFNKSETRIGWTFDKPDAFTPKEIDAQNEEDEAEERDRRMDYD